MKQRSPVNLLRYSLNTRLLMMRGKGSAGQPSGSESIKQDQEFSKKMEVEPRVTRRITRSTVVCDDNNISTCGSEGDMMSSVSSLSLFKKSEKKKISHGSHKDSEGVESKDVQQETLNEEHTVDGAAPAASPENHVKTVKPRKRNQVSVQYESTSATKKDKWEPPNWLEMLKNIREMRKSGDAPVDTMGCDKCMDEDGQPEVLRYQTLLSLMLSSQTKDVVTHAAMQRLREHGCTIENILKTDDKVLEDLIHPVGFKKTKVKYIKRTSEILRDKFNSDIPDTVEKLCELPGVGPKMAHLCMLSGWGVVTGIGVDTHVHRISNRIGWVPRTTKTPEETRKALEDWLPLDLWQEVNHLLVGFGQTICRPVGPHCGTCLSANICPFARSTVKVKGGRKS